MWTPDVYEGRSPVTALFAIAPKVFTMALMMRLTFQLSDQSPINGHVLIALSLASMAIGAFGAIMQNDIKG